MFCPSCGVEVSSLKFCENCGSPLPGDPQQGLDVQQAQPESPAAQSWRSETHSSPSSTFQTPYPYQQPASAYQYQVSSQGAAPNAAFVLVIVGLILSLLFVTFVPGVVCSIVGLALNAGYNKKGMNNPRRTPTLVIGIIGIVVAVICLIVSLIIGIIAVEVIENGGEHGATPVSPLTAAQSASASSAQSEGSGASVLGSVAGDLSSSASSAADNGKYDDELYHDAEYNPTLYALIELTGSELQSLLSYYNFYWDDDAMMWLAVDGSMFGVEDAFGEFSGDRISALPKGAAGQSAVMVLVVEGYGTSKDAFTAATGGNVQVEAQAGIDDVYFGIVRNSDSARYLVAVTGTGLEDEQSILLFTEESVSSNLFSTLIGTDAGSSIDEVWSVIDMLT